MPCYANTRFLLKPGFCVINLFVLGIQITLYYFIIFYMRNYDCSIHFKGRHHLRFRAIKLLILDVCG